MADPPNTRGIANPRFEPIPVHWYAVVNDLVGGWAVSHIDKPLSQQDFRNGEGDIADFCSEAVARHIADLHNTWMAEQSGGRDVPNPSAIPGVPKGFPDPWAD